MKRLNLNSLLFLVLLILFNNSRGADIYVSPNGNDEAEGTSEAPLRTLEVAKNKAAQLKLSGPVTVYLLPGTYYLSKPLVFEPNNSGTATAPITFKGCGGKAIISGGIRVTSSWTTHSGSIMKTTIEPGLKVDQLFLNGKRQIMARYPNYNENQYLQGYAADALTKAAACASPAEGPGYVRALHNQMWGGESYIITGKSGNSVTLSWVGDNNRGSTMHGTYRMVENIYELLDAPGEWFYRKSTGELFFWPPSGTDLNNQSTVVELSSLTELIRFVGTGPSSEESVKYITFDNVVFTHTYRSLFDGTGQFYEFVTKSDWGIVRKGAIFLQNAEYITIKNCLFDQIGGNGIFFSGYNRKHVVHNCVFEEAGASCVCIFGLRSSIRCPNSWTDAGTCNDKTPGPASNEYPAYITISNNLMHRLGRFEKQTAGITCSATEFDTIRHNTIYDIPRAGINFCDGCWGGHVIDYNWVYDCVKESGDHGPFNAWGRDRNERWQNDVQATFYDARSTTYIRYNRFEVSPGNFGIDLDDQASNYYQEYNLLIGGGFKLQWNRYNTYLNCILVGGANVQFHGVWSNSNHYGARNIIYNDKETCVYQFCCGSDPSQVKSVIKQWDSNVVYTPRGDPKCSEWNNCNSGNYSWNQWKQAGLDAHSVVADPQFTDPQKTWGNGYKPKGDYNPKSGSPALALGFKPFPMDSFGVMGTPGPYNCSCPSTSSQKEKRSQNFSVNSLQIKKKGNILYLTLPTKESCELFITTTSGKTLKRIKTDDGSININFNNLMISNGIYTVIIHTKKGYFFEKFIVNNK